MSTSRMSLSAYRPRPGRDDEVVPHLREEVATLRAYGYITSRPAPICLTARGEYLVISEWATETSVDEAHADDVILEVWRRKEKLVEYIAPADLEGSGVPFASYDILEDACDLQIGAPNRSYARVRRTARLHSRGLRARSGQLDEDSALAPSTTVMTSAPTSNAAIPRPK